MYLDLEVRVQKHQHALKIRRNLDAILLQIAIAAQQQVVSLPKVAFKSASNYTRTRTLLLILKSDNERHLCRFLVPPERHVQFENVFRLLRVNHHQRIDAPLACRPARPIND